MSAKVTVRFAGPILAVMIALGGCAHRVTRANASAAPPTAVATNMRRQILNAADAGDGDATVNQLRRRMAADPANVALRLELAAHYHKVGVPELELEHLRVATERFPESREAHLALADALRSSGVSRDAAVLLESFSRRNAATDTELLNRIGICYDEAGDWPSGEQAFRRALLAAPRAEYVHNNLGYNLLEQQRLTEAVAEFRQALQINAESDVARNNLGIALARLAVKDGSVPIAEALQHFENATDAATARSNLAAILIEQSRYEESRRLLQAALDYNRSNAAALANLKLLSELDGKPAEVQLRARRAWHPLHALKRVFVKTETRSSNTQRSGVAKKGEPR